VIDPVHDIIEAYDQGTYTHGDALNRILSLATQHPIEEIVASLPDPWRTDFLSWARRTFDNEIPLDEFVIISEGITTDEDLRPIAIIREWFRREKGRQ
jgi:hypothetical protein